MANLEKKKEKLKQRIKDLEFELTNTLQKKTVGSAINVSEYTTRISDLKKQLKEMEK